jgi:hypothetical protein
MEVSSTAAAAQDCGSFGGKQQEQQQQHRTVHEQQVSPAAVEQAQICIKCFIAGVQADGCIAVLVAACFT